ncbi:hypothetical protein DVH05_011850 [Phytophthora capsici]|nr:hypothetical protein DVH05_011843 [Phytophthora capsici]KAG1684145.1 hypothetical protein DVH05_011850 [Phytophthora capsici]
MNSNSPPTMESDVFALGMCILEAVTMRAPWKPLPDKDVRVAMTTGVRLPPRPIGLFSDDQWALVTRMCSFDPRRRPKISSVVHQLETFVRKASAVQKTQLNTKQRAIYAQPGIPTEVPSLESEINPTAPSELEERSISDMLGAVQSMVGSAGEYSVMNEQLCARIIDIYSKLRIAASPWSGVLVDNSAKPRQWWIQAAQHHIEAASREKKASNKAHTGCFDWMVQLMICAPTELHTTGKNLGTNSVDSKFVLLLVKGKIQRKQRTTRALNARTFVTSVVPRLSIPKLQYPLVCCVGLAEDAPQRHKYQLELNLQPSGVRGISIQYQKRVTHFLSGLFRQKKSFSILINRSVEVPMAQFIKGNGSTPKWL